MKNSEPAKKQFSKLLKPFLFLIICVALFFSCSYSYSYESKKMHEGINQAIEQVNYCSYDSDCKVADFNCPFGNRLVNKTADLSKIKKMISKYEIFCGTCDYDIVAPKKDDIKCRGKKCVVESF